ncbi:MAG: metallophosphoesterase family protein [Clostridium sp.]|uniref:metallophosphoesterase family protein n=1 Tax=Clostridium sp. TaxID=1506 RepID=UPI003D6D6124
MKQLCVISDIHSNFTALNIFLEYIEKIYDIEYILNLGDFLEDYIKDGDDVCGVFDTVIYDKKFINIIGNTEFNLIYKDLGDGLNYEGDKLHEVQIQELLGQERIKDLRKVPLSKSVELYGKKFFLAHADNEYGTYNLIDLVQVIRQYSLDEFSEQDKILNINEHDYILVADNHIQQMQQSAHYTFIKPGAIGAFDQDYTIRFAIIEIDENEENVNFKNLKHDVSKVYAGKDFFWVSISNIYDTNVIPMNFSFWKPVMEHFVKTNKYIEFGCWKTDAKIIEELSCNLKNFEKEIMENQIFFKGEINEQAIKILLNDYLEDGAIKWFDVNLYDEENKMQFTSSHYGKETYIMEATVEEVGLIKASINEKRVCMRIS